jgi:hypothetical protein
MWLISRRYRCNIGDCNHVFNAHDKKVMAQMPDFIQQLFPVAILNNKLAVHTDLQHLLRLLIIGGKVAMAKVQGVLSELEHMHSLHLEIAKASLNLHAKGAMDRFIQTPGRADSATAAEHDGAPPAAAAPASAPTLALLPLLQPVSAITVDMLRNMYLEEYETMYEGPLRQRLGTVGGLIWRVDHSFKLVKVIRILCCICYATLTLFLSTQKIVQRPFKSTLCVMTEIGEIAAFWMLPNAQMASATGLLRDLAAAHQSPPKLVYVDNCCQVRPFFEGLLGKEIAVRLDPLHGIKRLGDESCPKHPLHKHLLYSLSAACPIHPRGMW